MLPPAGTTPSSPPTLVHGLIGPSAPQVLAPLPKPAPPRLVGFKKEKKQGRPKTPWLLREREPIVEEVAEPTIEEKIYAAVQAAQGNPEAMAALLAQYDAEAARISFPEFFKQAWKVVEPSTDLVWNWHLQLMCCVVQALFFDWLKTKHNKGYVNLCRNVLFNVPPGSSKSRVLAVCFQAWAWLHWPGMKFICLSVNDDATMRDARDARNLIRSPWYVNAFGIQWVIKDDQDAISNYGNTKGGERISMPSKSEIVGLRADCIAGDTLVATERGDVTIRELHETSELGQPLPLVWSKNHANGALELQRVVATRKSARTPTVILVSDRTRLQCTPGHRIWTSEGYLQAAELRGHEVSSLWRPDQTITEGDTTSLRELPRCDAHVCSLRDGVPALGGRVRQACTQRHHGRAVLHQTLQDDCLPAAGEDTAVHDLRKTVQTQGQGTGDLLGEVQWHQPLASEEGTRGHQLSTVPDGVPTRLDANDVLLQTLCGRGTCDPHEGERKLELLGEGCSHVLRRSLDEPCTTDSRARREPVHGVRQCAEPGQSDSHCAPRRPQPTEQRAGESDHTLRQVSYEAPQVQSATIQGVYDPSVFGRMCEVSVYDIQVEGNHNFFAAGLLVHNCLLIDDPNNPKKAENKNERDEINQLWSTNQYNRVNDMQRSLRVGVQQRTNAADWTGNVLDLQGTWSPNNLDGWLHVVLPAEYEIDRSFVMPEPLRALLLEYLPESEILLKDPRTVEGESLDKTRLPTEVLAGERKRWAGTGNYQGQMQQRPSALTGAKVDRAWWGWARLAGGVRENVDDLETGRPRPAHCHNGDAVVVHSKHHSKGNWDLDWITISVDCASKKTEKGSNYGILVIAGKGGRRFVLDDRTQRGALHEIIAVLKELIYFWKPDSLLIEAKAAGPDVMDTLRESMGAGDLPMVSIEEVEPGNQDKEMRLEAATPYIKNGFVYLLDGAPWLEAFVEELSMFPNGLRDDRVDALSQCLNHKRAADDTDWPDF